MKKNKFLKLASGLLMLVLITCCAVSGTFAKYVTTGGASDVAQVAKWGMTITFTEDKAFAAESILNANYTEGTGATVVASSTYNVIAPGTEGTLANVNVKGKPEVKFNLDVVVDLDLGAKWTTTGTDVYCPLLITINGTTFKIDATNDTTAKLETAVENAIKDYYNGTYEANDSTFETGKVLVVTWAWGFDGDHVKDTALGDKAANGDAPVINFSITITATQID